MKYSRLITSIAGMGILCGDAHLAPAAVVVDVDMDTLTPGIQTTRTAAINDIFTIALLMTADAAGISSYAISVNFDNIELALNGAPASVELLPPGFAFNITSGVASESQATGAVRTFEAGTFGAGPVSTQFTVGTISFKATLPVTDALLDVTPGLFNVGIDGISDNAGGDLGPTAVFNGGRVNLIPEPASAALLAGGFAVMLAMRRRRTN